MKKYIQKNQHLYYAALLCILVSTLFAVSLQFYKGKVLDYALAGNLKNTITSGALLIIFILFENLFYYAYCRIDIRFVTNCTKLLKKDIFKSILNRNYVVYKEQTQGDYLAKYTNESDAIKDLYFKMLPFFWEILFKIIFVSISLFILDWRIAIITIILLSTPLFVPKMIEKPLQNAQTESLISMEIALAKVNDWSSGFEIIKNYSIEKRIMYEFNTINNESMDKMLQNERLGAIAQLITTLISYISYYIVLICSAWLVLRGVFSAGDFFIAIGMIDQLSYPLISLSGIIRHLIGIKSTCESTEKFINDGFLYKTTDEKDSFEKRIIFNNVSFGYDNKELILKDFNLLLEKGKLYLIKGPSGCGKTTIINLLLKYYEVGAGTITIDDRNIECYGNTYGLITVVRQEAILFHDTLRNNLTMYQDISDATLICTLKSVGLHKYATTNGLNSFVEENGSNFSGGEKKRICLARALLRNTNILILDEPLANLDSVTVNQIENLILSIKEKTIIVVSHQFSSEKLNKFDTIITLSAK
ncbi:MAG: ABC transporter ATP-binding protein [Agathobacter sp.]|nr:ABC transporter ATP-binding protein [Agathobacter sp.]